ncbi:MAG: hypothetical protein JJU28_08745 [Cyclobacteriaceae bacterium]|nr:hypothetical protein [Cyclobacteriaceae bacterium]
MVETRITITTDNQKLIDKILLLLKKEEATYQLEDSNSPVSEKVVGLMNKYASQNLIHTIKDPKKWQQKDRVDRSLPQR